MLNSHNNETDHDLISLKFKKYEYITFQISDFLRLNQNIQLNMKTTSSILLFAMEMIRCKHIQIYKWLNTRELYSLRRHFTEENKTFIQHHGFKKKGKLL